MIRRGVYPKIVDKIVSEIYRYSFNATTADVMTKNKNINKNSINTFSGGLDHYPGMTYGEDLTVYE